MTIKSIAHVVTDRPARYGKQLAGHFSKKCTTGWDGAEGLVEFPAPEGAADQPARLVLRAAETLELELTAPAGNLAEMEHVVARHLVMFGHKDDLRVDFERADGTAGLKFGVADLPEEILAKFRGRE